MYEIKLGLISSSQINEGEGQTSSSSSHNAERAIPVLQREGASPTQISGLQNYQNVHLQSSKCSREKSTGRDFKMHGQSLNVFALFGKMDQQRSFPKSTEVI